MNPFWPLSPSPNVWNFTVQPLASVATEPTGAIQTEVSGDLVGENGAILGEN